MALYLLYGIVSITRRFKLTELLVYDNFQNSVILKDYVNFNYCTMQKILIMEFDKH